jgi:peptidoglycan hydrolase-like protein with peptidoglycan-binding domain
VTADAARLSTDQGQVNAAEHALAAARSALTATDRQATVYGQDSTFTRVPSPGEIVRRGHTLFAIDGEPVLLLYGSTVATRVFAAGMSPGLDVAELNGNLDALGYAHHLTGDAFTAATAAAVRRLQAAHGEPQTGRLLMGSVSFQLGPVRVTSVMPTVAVGSGVIAGPVLSASWVTRQVSIRLDAGLEGQVKVGDPVTITLPNNQTTPGRISYVSSVASSGQNGSTIAVDAVPTDPAATGELDQAPVNVSITTGSVSNVLVVPVDALLALSRGGYAVEEIASGRHHLVAVTTGLFDDADGLVQVSGSGLAVGQRVVVPGQ